MQIRDSISASSTQEHQHQSIVIVNNVFVLTDPEHQAHQSHFAAKNQLSGKSITTN